MSRRLDDTAWHPQATSRLPADTEAYYLADQPTNQKRSLITTIQNRPQTHRSTPDGIFNEELFRHTEQP